MLGVSAGTVLALTRFPGRRILISLVNTGMGLPPVVVGLFVSISLWRNGPLGVLGLLYTPTAMIIAQSVIATPIVTGISLAAIQQLPRKLRLQILALGATRWQMVRLLLREARLPLLAAVMAGFGGVISEVGASIMVGGNIKGLTRVLTTATVMETGPGQLRRRDRAQRHPAAADLRRELPADAHPAARAPAVSAAAPILEVRGLRVRKGGADLLDIPALAVAAGETLSLIGPNGAGKSTLLLALSGIEQPAAGELRFRGERVPSGAASLAYRRRIAMVFQEPLLFDTTVFENVASGLRLRGVAKGEIGRRVGESLERFRIGHLADRSARTLSGGEAQRTSLARAMAVAPEILLLDEPFAALDPQSREGLIEDLARTLRETGTTTVFVTHDRVEAQRLADRIAVLERGRAAAGRHRRGGAAPPRGRLRRRRSSASRTCCR